MKGCYFLGAEHSPKFEIRQMSFDDIAAHDIIVRIKSCGVCGTDVHIYKGEKGSADVVPPVVLGHEFSGIVVKTGKDVTLVKEGDHVAIDPNMYCGRCASCRMGKKQNCEHLFALGVNTDGGFAEYCKCPETQVYSVDKRLDFDEAAMVEPLACVIHGIDQACIQSGETVLIIGGGTIGLLMTQMARIEGASRIIVSEPSEFRRKMALQFGADVVIDPGEEQVERKIQLLTGRNADVVIECVGKKFSSEQAFRAAGNGGRVLLFGVPSPTETAEISLFDIYKKELKIMGSIINPDTHQRAVNLLNSGRIEIKQLITHQFGLDEVEEAIQKQMSQESIKVMVHP